MPAFHVFISAAKYLGVPVWELVERYEAGEHIWLNWAQADAAAMQGVEKWRASWRRKDRQH